MKSIETVGKTIDDAVAQALKQLGTTRENVEIEVLESGNKGFFGFIGGKEAKVRVTVIDESKVKAQPVTEKPVQKPAETPVSAKASNNAPKADVVAFLQDVFAKMNVEATAEIESENDDKICIDIKGTDVGILIGRRGETLDSLQYLASLVYNKGKDGYKRIVLDAENYRKKREETLIKLGEKVAARVTKYRKNVTLESMNPYERRIIHESLQNVPGITTFSVGVEPNRKIVVAVKRKDD